MTGEPNNPYDSLGKLFHEPNRLAIMSALCAAERGLSFGELREACNLTDGNLNRHLNVLDEAGAIKIKKSFIGNKPRTTVFISKKGLESFTEYLKALEEVLITAQKRMSIESAVSPNPLTKPILA